jgi:hypothetical protein
MAWALGLTVKSVSIKPRGNSHGQVTIDVPRWVSRGDPKNPVVRLWAEANIMSQMSGFVAERRYRGRANHVGAFADYASTYETASALTFSRKERHLFLDWLFARTCSLMRRLSAQRAVNAVARVLLEKELISVLAVARIANRAWES